MRLQWARLLLVTFLAAGMPLAAHAAQRQAPAGPAPHISMSLQPPATQPGGGIRFVCRITNVTNVPWTVNVDRVAPADPEKMHRALAACIVEAPPTTRPATQPAGSGPSPPATVFASHRPWMHKPVLETARTGRPDRPMDGAAVLLRPSEHFDATVELRRTPGGEYQVLINGVPDGPRRAALRPGVAYEMIVRFEDDYHYWAGNGAKINAVNPLWGRTQCPPVRFAVPP